MTKVKLYNPDTQGTFKMMFGFAQPTKFTVNGTVNLKFRRRAEQLSRAKIKKEYEERKKRCGQTKQEQGFNKRKNIQND